MSAPKLKRWEILPSTGSHFDVLDGLRGMAILLVVSFHTLYTNPADGLISRLFGYIFVAGWMGVPVFFVLSGFLISYPFFKGRFADRQFWWPQGYGWRRAAKIIPPFYLSIILLLGYYWWQFHDPSYFSSALKWATGLGNFISISPNFNGVYWSLIVECHFYIVLPVLFWLTRGLSAHQTGLVLFGLLLFIPVVARQMVWPDLVYTLPDFTTPQTVQVWLALTRFPNALDYFAWGVFFASIHVSIGAIKDDRITILSYLGYAGGCLMLVTLVFWGLWVNQFDIRAHVTRWSIEISHLLPALATMLMLFFIFDRNNLGSRFFSLGWLRFIGIVSYEWFLFHGAFVGWFHDHFGASRGNVFAYAERTILPLLLSFGFSVLVYRYFSLPILNRVRERVRAPAG